MKRIVEALLYLAGGLSLLYGVCQLGAAYQGGQTVVHEIAALCWLILGVLSISVKLGRK